MSPQVLPAADTVARLLSGLVGRSVSVKPAAANAKPIGPACMVASYAGTDGSGGTRFVFDLPAAASLGAALTMFPAAVAQEAARSGQLEEGLLDSFHEICNVMSQLAGSESMPALVLTDLAPLNLARAKDLDKLLPAVSARVDYELAVSGYAEGRLVILFG